MIPFTWRTMCLKYLWNQRKIVILALVPHSIQCRLYTITSCPARGLEKVALRRRFLAISDSIVAVIIVQWPMYIVRHFHEHRQKQWKLHHNSVFNDEKGLLSLVKMIGWSKSMVQQLLPSFNIWLEKNHCHSVWRKEVLSSGLPIMVGWVEYQLFRKVAGDVLRRYACSSVVFDKWYSRKGRQFDPF